MGADFNKKAYEEIYKHGTWEQTAVKIGRKATGDSVRMEFERFMKDF